MTAPTTTRHSSDTSDNLELSERINQELADGATPLQVSSDVSAIITILTSMYSDPVRAIVREYTSNALDATRASGSNEKVIVSYDEDNENITIQDFGTGMTRFDLENNFSKYLYSSKKGESEQKGQHGIGFKSAFMITPIFHVITTKDGWETVAELLMEDGTGVIVIKTHTQTTNSNGTKVTIPLHKKISESRNENVKDSIRDSFFRSLRGANLEEVVIHGLNSKQAQQIQQLNEGKISYKDYDFYLNTKGNKRWYRSASTIGDALGEPFVWVNYDGDLYPLESESEQVRFLSGELQKCVDYIIIRVPLKAIDFTPSRDDIAYTPKTTAYLSEKMGELTKGSRETWEGTNGINMSMEDENVTNPLILAILGALQSGNKQAVKNVYPLIFGGSINLTKGDYTNQYGDLFPQLPMMRCTESRSNFWGRSTVYTPVDEELSRFRREGNKWSKMNITEKTRKSGDQGTKEWRFTHATAGVQMLRGVVIITNAVKKNSKGVIKPVAHQEIKRALVALETARDEVVENDETPSVLTAPLPPSLAYVIGDNKESLEYVDSIRNTVGLFAHIIEWSELEEITTPFMEEMPKTPRAKARPGEIPPTLLIHPTDEGSGIGWKTITNINDFPSDMGQVLYNVLSSRDLQDLRYCLYDGGVISKPNRESVEVHNRSRKITQPIAIIPVQRSAARFCEMFLRFNNTTPVRVDDDVRRDFTERASALTPDDAYEGALAGRVGGFLKGILNEASTGVLEAVRDNTNVIAPLRAMAHIVVRVRMDKEYDVEEIADNFRRLGPYLTDEQKEGINSALRVLQNIERRWESNGGERISRHRPWHSRNDERQQRLFTDPLLLAMVGEFGLIGKDD